MVKLILYFTFGCCWTYSYHDTFQECITAGQHEAKKDNSVVDYECCSTEECRSE